MASNIRVATPSDAAAVLEIYGPFCEDSPITFETRIPALAEMEGRIRDIAERFPWLVCDNGTDVLGYAYAGPHRERSAYRWSVDVAVYIAGGYRGHGIGTALYTALFDLLRIQGFYRHTLASRCRTRRVSNFTGDSDLSLSASTSTSDSKAAPGMTCPGGTLRCKHPSLSRQKLF